MENYKIEQNENIKEWQEEIAAMKDKMDKTEYIIQFKEEIWTYLEREINKVIKKDSELYRKVQAKTRILTDCLAQTKVSNVVKQNASLVEDHAKACSKVKELLTIMQKDLISESNKFDQNDDFYSRTPIANKLRSSLLSSIDCFDVRLNKMENVELSELVKQLSQVIDVMRTKSSLVEEENVYYREECAKLMQKLS
jgi:hypothetical protein